MLDRSPSIGWTGSRHGAESAVVVDVTRREEWNIGD
jgi:hypothetical protein